ncbi:MAG: hypothetical protein K6C05_01745 [Anaerovibrio sp.]|uniref:hypothetical protein n=1 Tax=Anaerovibrio sp. TaxID=1872532 RepID=UPI0025E95D4C|nr:hypothetical protein [Anaerovibrio sp.]MCR5175553.1 hypothetical protein [Anaerovibrio sp.]
MGKNKDVAITFALQDYLKGIDPKKKNKYIKNMLARLSEYKETDNTITIFFNDIDWTISDKEIATFMDVAKDYDYIFQEICDEESDKKLNVVHASNDLFSCHEEPAIVKKFTM